MSRIENLIERGAKAAHRVEVGIAVLGSRKYASDLRRPFMVDYCVGEYVKAIQGLQAQGQAQNDRARAELERRRDLRSEALSDDLAASFKGVSDSAVEAWKQRCAGMSVKELADAYRNSTHDWQKYVIEMNPRTEVTPVAGNEVTVAAKGWGAIETAAKEREAQTLDLHARMGGLPTGSLSTAAIEKEEGALRADQSALAQIDALGWERHIRQTFRLGDAQPPTATRDELATMAFHLEGLRIPVPEE